jgi:predicted amidophosphoribosyltransferase
MRVGELAGVLLDLVLPQDCAGCGGPAGVRGACERCVACFAPRATRPDPSPVDLPPCVTAATYAGPARELILAYKERGRRGLAGPLGDALAGAVAAPLAPGAALVVLVPVPSTPAAIRARHGDHMRLLARRAVRRLRRVGRPVALAAPLRARPKVDSARLDRAGRAAAARHAFDVRPSAVAALRAVAGAGAAVVLVDDVITTGATLSAMTDRLAEHGVAVSHAATVAATVLRLRS